MIDVLRAAIAEHPDAARRLLEGYLRPDRPFLVRSEIWDEFRAIAADVGDALADSRLSHLLFSAQEAAHDGRSLVLAIRQRIGRWAYLSVTSGSLEPREIGVSEYLRFKERLVGVDDPHALEFDIAPFGRDFPRLAEARTIGRGVEYLNRTLSSRLFFDISKGDRKLLQFLRAHSANGTQLMLDQTIQDVGALQAALRAADDLLDRRPDATPWPDIAAPLARLGFLPGWGADAARARETLQLLSDILEAPEPGILERFLARVPMIFSVAILSPHGYFGQHDVLGRPDTGGQVVYILDQVRALEREMRKRVAEQGIEIEPRIYIVTRLIPDFRFDA